MLRSLLLVTALALAAVPGSANAVRLPPPPQPVEGAAFKWLVQPSYMRISEFADDSPRGWAEVECVMKKRQPSDCVVLAAEPADTRMGRFVIKVAEEFVASSTDTAGNPVEGRKVRYTLGVGRTVIP